MILRYLFGVLFLLISASQPNNLVIHLSDDLYLDENYLSNRYDNVQISSDNKRTVYGNFKIDGEIDIDNPPTIDGIYQITMSSKGRFLHTGSYANIDFQGIRIHRGAIVELSKGKWKRYSKGRIRFDGNLKIENVRFSDIHFLFDFEGNKQNRTIEIRNSSFENIARIFAADRINSADNWAGRLQWKNSQNGHSFSRITIRQNVFSNIKESILWGSPTYKNLVFDENSVLDSPNITTLLNLLPYNSKRIHNSYAFITNNKINNIVSKQEQFSEVSRPLFRVISNTLIYNNVINNYNGIAFFLTGNNISVIQNDLKGSGTKTKWHQNAVIMYKGVSNDKLLSNNVIGNTVSNTNGCFIHWSYPQNFRVINNSFSRISSPNTTNSVYSFEQGNTPYKKLHMHVESYNNYFKSETFLRFIGGDTEQDLIIKSGDILEVKDTTRFKFNAKKVLLKNKEYRFKK